MGLAERRIVKAYQEGEYVSLVNEINSLMGSEIEFDINWDSLSSNGQYSHIWEESFTKVYFTPIINAFNEITADDMGKEALQETLVKIVIKDDNDIYSANRCYAFVDGVLTVDHSSYSNVGNVDERTSALVEILESQL
ncbi:MULTISPECIES: hypothetical protein [Aquimarina]|uniref:Uncharacterized protein n=1 Tax=Aquimarina algiphila TaxID=2047982 RepID=A0A554VKL8_9FLAO|nr:MULTISPECIES: hypothetical protein [Aquimarina]TSE08573.1 hypothetical protein FOF46_11480 [Aquimarina algiphila]